MAVCDTEEEGGKGGQNADIQDIASDSPVSAPSTSAGTNYENLNYFCTSYKIAIKFMKQKEKIFCTNLIE